MITDGWKRKLLTMLSFSYKKESKLAKLNFVTLVMSYCHCLVEEPNSDFNNFHKYGGNSPCICEIMKSFCLNRLFLLSASASYLI